MKILITGSNGLLGQKIVAQLLRREIQFVATSQGENRNSDCPAEFYQSLNITNKKEVIVVLENSNATHLIHTAAITNVDECESNPELCNNVNMKGTRNLVEQAKKQNIHFQLVSTDFVFDGEKGNYKEEDEVNPLSVYAKSKGEGEKMLVESDYSNWSIVRTIIVYGIGNNLSRSNLLVWAKSALTKGDTMNIVDDQFRAPTWADDLAWGCIRICELHKNGIFHLSGPKTYSIYNIVQVIADYYNLSMENVNKIKTASLNQPAKRPPKTGFDLSKSIKELGYSPKSIQETLDLL